MNESSTASPAAIRKSNPIEGSTLVASILTGQIAGLIMAVVVILVFVVVYGTTLFYPVQVIGSFAFGEDALVGTNVAAVIAGLVIHQAGPALLWGALFGVIAAKIRIDSVVQALGIGLGVGIVSMLGPYVLIPTLMNLLHGVDIWNREVPTGWDWAAHLVFGASFAFFPKVRNALGRRS